MGDGTAQRSEAARHPASAAALLDRARAVARSLAGASEGYPFTEGLLACKVAGHVFAIVAELDDDPTVTVKAEPAHADALIRAHESIAEGRYLDKRHWVSIAPGPGVTTALVDELVRDSYDLVVARLTARERAELTPGDDARRS